MASRKNNRSKRTNRNPQQKKAAKIESVHQGESSPPDPESEPSTPAGKQWSEWLWRKLKWLLCKAWLLLTLRLTFHGVEIKGNSKGEDGIRHHITIALFLIANLAFGTFNPQGRVMENSYFVFLFVGLFLLLCIVGVIRAHRYEPSVYFEPKAKKVFNTASNIFGWWSLLFCFTFVLIFSGFGIYGQLPSQSPEIPTRDVYARKGRVVINVDLAPRHFSPSGPPSPLEIVAVLDKSLLEEWSPKSAGSFYQDGKKGKLISLTAPQSNHEVDNGPVLVVSIFYVKQGGHYKVQFYLEKKTDPPGTKEELESLADEIRSTPSLVRVTVNGRELPSVTTRGL